MLSDSMSFGEAKLQVGNLAIRLECNGLEGLLRQGPVLDVGCSQGNFVFAVKAKYPNALCIGIDINTARLNVARYWLPTYLADSNSADGCHFLAATSDRLPFNDKTFSLVHFFLLLDYSDSPIVRLQFSREMFAKETYRVLKKSGVCIAAEGSYARLDCFFDAGFRHLEPERHRDDVVSLLQK